MALQPSSARLRQKRRQRMILFMLVLLLAGGIAFWFVSNKNKKPAVQQRPPGHVAVPVINRDIPLGTRISNQMYTISFKPPREVPTDAILSRQQFIGRYATRPIAAGDYLRETDVTDIGAHKGFSGFAKPGKRAVVLEAKLFPGSADTLSIGDRVDLLSIGSPTGITAGKSLAASATTLQGGGSQPGDPNSPARQLARARAAMGGSNVSATSATLIAEDAEVMAVPKKGSGRDRGIDFFVLQMEPEDAHVTMLAAASGATLRTVFRPFNDRVRLTPAVEPKPTARMPRPTKDPDVVTIIAGAGREMHLPYSKIHSDDSSFGNANDDLEGPNYITGRDSTLDRERNVPATIEDLTGGAAAVAVPSAISSAPPAGGNTAAN